ncbi:MAG: hypothetical protein EBU79_00650 [Betaproteobacteria bacterium]|nr:hypothetical protein [Betaproteobacteria bacterium]
MTKHRRAFNASLVAAGMGLMGSTALKSQTFPAKPIKIIVPFPVGGTTDLVARMVAQRMSQSMGQAVTVENKAGAGGAIGADTVAKAAPDGYTMLMHNLTFPMTSVAQTLAGRSPFNVDTDLIGVSISVFVPFMWTAHPSVPARDLRELAQLLRSQKLEYNYGSTGPGSAMHVQGEAFKKEAQVAMGAEPVGSSAAAQDEIFKRQMNQFRPIIREMNIES